MVFSGAALPAAHCCLKVGPLGPADGAAEGAELGCGAPDASYGSTAGLDVLDHGTLHSTAGLDVLDHVTLHPRTGWDRSCKFSMFGVLSGDISQR